MAKRTDLIGQTFNYLTVLKREGSDKWGMAIWQCQCGYKECGRILNVRTSDLKSGNTKWCGNHSNSIDLTGQHFGYLLVLNYIGFIKKKTVWNCLCEACGSKKEMRSDDLPSRVSCGCLSNSPEVIEARKQTNLGRYGVVAPAQLQEVRDKMKATTLERYGVENALQSNDIKERVKRSNLIKYGVEWGVQNAEIKEKIRQSTELRTSEIREQTKIKRIQTNIDRYGFSAASQNKEVKERGRQTNLERHGVEWTSQLPEVQEKIRHTRGILEAISTLRDNPTLLRELLSKYDCFTVGQKLGVSDVTVSRWARYHGINDGYRSILERSIATWLDTTSLVFRTDRTILGGYEIDRYCREKHLGIEINGLVYHSEMIGKKDKHYHIWKHEKCQENGIRLITIFEDEWYDRQQAVQTVIRTQLGLQERGPGARQLQIQQVNNKKAKQFFEDYHIQGSTTTSYCIGAYYEGNLVAVMGFGHTVRQSQYKVELKRFCTDGRIYPGIGSRLFKIAIKENQYTSIVSFCDKRYFVGKSYELMGFQNDGEIPPDYTYTCDYRTRHHKSKFRLSKIQKLIDEDVNTKSEWEWMQELGYDRIWDCGKIRYVWTSLPK